MKIGQIIRLVGVTGLFLAGILAPTTYATEDGQFPVFPTVVGDTSSTTIDTPTEETTITKAVKTVEREEVGGKGARTKSDVVTNESGVFSPWGTVKRAFTDRAQAGENGVAFALTTLNAKPTRQGDLRYQISYANNTSEVLREAKIEVFLPKNLQYLDSDLRPSSKKGGVVAYEVGKIAAGEKGVIQLETRLKNQKETKAIIVPATMEYEDIDGNKYTVTAATNNAVDGKNGGLTASALDSVSGFLVWLFVIALLAALAFVSYQYLTLKASDRRA